MDLHDFGADQLIFRTRSGRAQRRRTGVARGIAPLRAAGVEPRRLYDCRHAAATAWLKAGVPLGEVANRLGHSVETLVSTYVGALAGDDELANRRIEEVVSSSFTREAS